MTQQHLQNDKEQEVERFIHSVILHPYPCISLAGFISYSMLDLYSKLTNKIDNNINRITCNVRVSTNKHNNGRMCCCYLQLLMEVCRNPFCW